MASEQELILRMLQDDKITVREAERLLALIHRRSAPREGFSYTPGSIRRRRRHRWGRHADDGRGAGFLRIEIDENTPEGRVEKARLRVPVRLLRAGINLSGVLPRETRRRVLEALREKGIEVDPFALRDMEPEELAETLSGLDFEIDGAHIRVRRVDDEEEPDPDPDGDPRPRH